MANAPDSPSTRVPSFLEHTPAKGTATLASFNRVAHPRASAPAPFRPSAPNVSARASTPRPTAPEPRASQPAEAHAHVEYDGMPHVPPTPPEPPPSNGRASAPLEPVASAPRPPASDAPVLPRPSSPDFAPRSGNPTHQLTQAVESLRLHASRLAEQARADALEIGFQVAKRILELEVTTSPEPLFALVKSAVRRVGDAKTLVVKLHPEDADRVQSAEGKAKTGLSLLQVEIVADGTLARGDCVVQTESATVDGRLSTRLDEVQRGLTRALQPHGSTP